jgi:hypothetical protein
MIFYLIFLTFTNSLILFLFYLLKNDSLNKRYGIKYIFILFLKQF